jgi:hypothetical protein
MLCQAGAVCFGALKQPNTWQKREQTKEKEIENKFERYLFQE